jgi:hypothetical protein
MAERKKRRSKIEIQTAKEQVEKKKAMRESAKKQDKALISKFVKVEFQKQIQKGPTALVNGYHTSSGRFEYKILLHNWETNAAILKITESGWREGLWFYCFDSEKFVKFEKDIHRPMPGNKNVIWPNFQSN